MKSFTTNCLIAAMATVAAAGTASAAALKVEIPFAFRAGNTLMAPGTYRLSASYSQFRAPVMQISKLDGAASTVLMLYGSGTVAKDWARARQPTVRFECVEKQCSLATVWDGTSRDAMHFQSGTRRHLAGMSVITLAAVRTD